MRGQREVHRCGKGSYEDVAMQQEQAQAASKSMMGRLLSLEISCVPASARARIACLRARLCAHRRAATTRLQTQSATTVLALHLCGYWLPAAGLLLVLFYLPVNDVTTSCFARYWEPFACGVNGSACDFDVPEYRTLYCAKRCGRQLQEVLGSVWGGGDDNVYAASSFLCPAAVHAGLVEDSTGGCMQYKVVPGRTYDRTSWYFPRSVQLRSCPNGELSYAEVAAVVEPIAFTLAALYLLGCALLLTRFTTAPQMSNKYNVPPGAVVDESEDGRHQLPCFCVLVWLVGLFHATFFQVVTTDLATALLNLPTSGGVVLAVLFAFFQLYQRPLQRTWKPRALAVEADQRVREAASSSRHSEQAVSSSTQQIFRSRGSTSRHIEDGNANEAVEDPLPPAKEHQEQLQQDEEHAACARVCFVVAFLVLCGFFPELDALVPIDSFDTNLAESVERESTSTDSTQGKAVFFFWLMIGFFVLLGGLVARANLLGFRNALKVQTAGPGNSKGAAAVPWRRVCRDLCAVGVASEPVISAPTPAAASPSPPTPPTPPSPPRAAEDSIPRPPPQNTNYKIAVQQLRRIFAFYACALLHVLIVWVGLSDIFSPHLHHAAIGLLMLPVSGFAVANDIPSSIWLGVGQGLFIDGVLRWGLDPNAGLKDLQYRPEAPDRLLWMLQPVGAAGANGGGNPNLDGTMNQQGPPTGQDGAEVAAAGSSDEAEDDFWNSNATNGSNATLLSPPAAVLSLVVGNGSLANATAANSTAFPHQLNVSAPPPPFPGTTSPAAGRMVLVIFLKPAPRRFDAVLVYVNGLWRGTVPANAETESHILVQGGFTPNTPCLVAVSYLQMVHGRQKGVLYTMPSHSLLFTVPEVEAILQQQADAAL